MVREHTRALQPSFERGDRQGRVSSLGSCSCVVLTLLGMLLAALQARGEEPGRPTRRDDFSTGRRPVRDEARFMLARDGRGLWPRSWPRLRGPAGAGRGGPLPIAGTLTSSEWAWSTTLPGVGHASPVVHEGRIFAVSSDPTSAARIMTCHAIADGSLHWRIDQDAAHDHHHPQNSLASSSPVVDELAVYWTWTNAERLWVEAVDHDGQRLWQMSPGPYQAEHGHAASPAVWEDVLIVPMDQDGPSSVIGLDTRTGQQRWRVARQTARTSYATPLVLSGEQPMAILSSMSHGLSAIDPRDGRVLWELPCFPRRTVSSPVVAGDLLLGTCGEGGGNNLLVAVRLPVSASPDGTLPSSGTSVPEVAYQLERGVAPYVPTPLSTGERLFLWGDRGVVTCVDTATGKVRWRGRTGGNYSSSPVALGSMVVNVAVDGEVVFIADADHFEVLGRKTLGEASRATPAIADGRIIFRSEQKLFAADLAGP